MIESPNFVKLHLNRSIDTKSNQTLILREEQLYSVDLDSLNRTFADAVKLDHHLLRCQDYGTELVSDKLKATVNLDRKFHHHGRAGSIHSVAISAAAFNSSVGRLDLGFQKLEDSEVWDVLREVANAFVQQYYHTQQQSLSLVHRFYQEESKLAHSENDGTMSTTTTLQVLPSFYLHLPIVSFLVTTRMHWSDPHLENSALVNARVRPSLELVIITKYLGWLLIVGLSVLLLNILSYLSQIVHRYWERHDVREAIGPWRRWLIMLHCLGLGHSCEANGMSTWILLKQGFKLCKQLDLCNRLIIAMDVAVGMEYLHSKDILCFDLKCDNLRVNLKDPSRPIWKATMHWYDTSDVLNYSTAGTWF
ncbi:hypothetical protein RHGRI_023902 [Rhododendron griersonianum]|uniref:NTF2 domain-containing protein n=1 Tax=Rhododendron griersonianum TaxID=479676 RepID=A0AAV6J5D2_9ERIC|nr:hypothetical protein RHGRI_023902 [Rhododendron griersonianum]